MFKNMLYWWNLPIVGGSYRAHAPYYLHVDKLLFIATLHTGTCGHAWEAKDFVFHKNQCLKKRESTKNSPN